MHEVSQNRLNYFARLRLDPARAVSAEQVHGTAIRRVAEEDAGKGALDPIDRFASTDGFVTNVQGLVLTALQADCAAIYYADEKKRAVGLAHAGWRGILAGLPGEMLLEMTKQFGCDPKEIRVSIGPMICPMHYEVKPELAEDFRRRFGSKVVLSKAAKPYLDLYSALVLNLQANGLPPTQISSRPPCTFENSRYSSYRRDGLPTNSMLAWIVI